jgi:hypothetical protein
VECLFTTVMAVIFVAAQAARFLMANSLSASLDFMRIATVQQLPILVIIATQRGERVPKPTILNIPLAA